MSENYSVETLLSTTTRIAETLLKRDGYLTPTWTLCTSTTGGTPVVVATPFHEQSEKDKSAALIRLMCVAYDVDLLAFVSECWFYNVSAENVKHLTDEEVYQKMRAGDFDDSKVEGVNVVAMSRDRQLSDTYEIVRDDDQSVVDLKFNQRHDTDQGHARMSGRFVDILPPKRTVDAVPAELKEQMRRELHERSDIYDISDQLGGLN